MNQYRKMKTVRMLCIMVGSVLAAFLVPLAARAWLASPRPVEAPVMAAWDLRQKVSTNDYGMHPYPAVAAQSDQVYAMWSKLYLTGTMDYDPYYNQAGNYGDPGEWGADKPATTSDSGYETVNVDMAVDSAGGKHFVWAEATGTPTHTLYYSHNATGREQIAQYGGAVVPAVAAVGNNQVHVVWSQGSADIMHRYKDSGGWSSTTTVRSSSSLGNPAIAVDSSGRAHVAWDEGDLVNAEILYKNSDSPWSWSSAPVTVSGHPSEEGEQRRPAIATSSSNVYVVWCEYISADNQYVRFGQSTAWGSSARISGRLTANADSPTYLRPDIAVDDDGKLHVVFNGGTTGVMSDPEKIFYASSSDGVNWWSRNVSDPTDRNATTPAVAVSGGYVHVIWAEKMSAGGYEVIHRRKEPTQGGDLYLPIIMKSY